MITELEIRTDELSENTYRKIECIKKNQLALNNTLTEMKNTLKEPIVDWRIQ